MRRFSSLLWAFLFSSTVLSPLNATEETSRLIDLSKNIRCVTCGGQSIQDSPSDFALKIKKELQQRIAQGQKDAQIFQDLRERYGDDVLFDPPLNTYTLILWTVPFFLILLSIFLGYYRYHRMIKTRITP